VRQYEIRWADLPEPIGRRPVLLLTRTAAYVYLNKVLVAAGILSSSREQEFKRALGWAELKVL
jgi:hypothetical protein